MYRVGIDLGGMSIKVGIVDFDGKILIQKSADTNSEKGHLYVMEKMKEIIFELAEELSIKVDDIEYIGVGTPGTVDYENGIVISAYNLGFDNVNIRQILSVLTKRPVYVGNDADCVALAELYCGGGVSYDNILAITIGTGIGGGLIINRKPVSGSFNGGGEFGHMVISVNGRPCSCGRLGCFEAYSASSSLTKEIKRVASENKDSILVKLVGGDIEKLNPKILFEAKDRGCEVAISILDEYNLYLAEALANFINMFEPQIILVGGGISKQGENLLKDVRKLTLEKCFDKNSKVKIETAHHFNDAGIIGASFLGK